MKKVLIMSLMLISYLTHLVKLEASQSDEISVWKTAVQYGEMLQNNGHKIKNKDEWVMKLQRYTYDVSKCSIGYVNDDVIQEWSKNFGYCVSDREAIDTINNVSKEVRSITHASNSNEESLQKLLLSKVDQNALKIADTAHNRSLVEKGIDLNWVKKTQILMGLGAMGMASVALMTKHCEQLAAAPIAAVSAVTFLTGLYLKLYTTKRTANSKFEYSSEPCVVTFTGYDIRAALLKK